MSVKSYLPQLSAAHQLFFLRQHNPEGQGALAHEKLTWRWAVRPTPISLLYDARLEYSVKKGPEVYIEAPDLKIAAQGRSLPHVYSEQKQRLCLYLPSAHEWNHHMPLSQTLVHWTSLWLNFYEQWLYTGEWQGGGKHPQSGDKTKKKRTRKTFP